MIYIINGNAGHGKDELVTIAAEFATVNVVNTSMVDPLRKVMSDLLGPEAPKDENMRQFMAEVKESWAKLFDGPNKYVIGVLQEKLINADDIAFVHCRSPHEIYKLKTLLAQEFSTHQVKTLLVDARLRCDVITSNKSDASVYDYEYDITVDNNGTVDELTQKVKMYFI